ncbi:MAG: sulfurtransferase TusA family protein [Nitrososphaerales archaeon]
MNVKFKKIEEGKFMLDVLGYMCPFTTLQTLKALFKVKPGEILEVLTSNQPSYEAISKNVQDKGHKVLTVEKAGESIWRIIIQKKTEE